MSGLSRPFAYTAAARRTIIVGGRLAIREARLAASRRGQQGVQILTIEQLAARLAGGFARPIDADTLKQVLREVLPAADLGELDPIRTLPGMIAAAAETLSKVWRAGIDLGSRAEGRDRIRSMALIERAVLDRLPPSMMRPVDLVAAAMQRLGHAPAILGSVEVAGLTELSPCWRPLLLGLADHVPVVWNAGPRVVPDWLGGSAVAVERSEPQRPEIKVVSAATALHEAIEALRWARELVASGRAQPCEIGIAACRTADYDDAFVSLRAEGNFDLRFVHGVPAATSREGQAAAALADLVVGGISHNGVRRLYALVRGEPGLFDGLPADWTRILPRAVPLSDSHAWFRLLERVGAGDFSDGKDHRPKLRQIVELLAKRTDAASQAGEQMLSGQALRIWRKALVEAPASALGSTIGKLRLEDGLDACVSVAWMPASALAASPRRFVRLLGMSSRGWPRQAAEDCLLPEHLIPSAELDPLPVSAADRRDFATVLATTAGELVLSRPRRDAEGRLLGRSALLHDLSSEEYLGRNRLPLHAMSEGDRLFARPDEFGATEPARAALTCWRNWNRAELTPNDGMLREDHPVIRAILGRRHSATSLRMLLRNPAGFVWTYGLGLRAPDRAEEPLVLDGSALGDFLHRVLEQTVTRIEAATGLAEADRNAVERAVAAVVELTKRQWEDANPTPPAVIWKRTVAEAGGLSVTALKPRDEPLPDQRSYVEVAFGGAEPKRDDAALPWDPARPVRIAGTDIEIAGYIDRLDLAGDGSAARVRDYKFGTSIDRKAVLNHGRELQRCLYAFAVKALLGSEMAVEASLLFPRDDLCLPLADPDAVLDELTKYILASRESLRAGRALPGPDADAGWNELAFALPANAANAYCKRKQPLVKAALGDAARVWEVN